MTQLTRLFFVIYATFFPQFTGYHSVSHSYPLLMGILCWFSRLFLKIPTLVSVVSVHLSSNELLTIMRVNLVFVFSLGENVSFSCPQAAVPKAFHYTFSMHLLLYLLLLLPLLLLLVLLPLLFPNCLLSLSVADSFGPNGSRRGTLSTTFLCVVWLGQLPSWLDCVGRAKLIIIYTS